MPARQRYQEYDDSGQPPPVVEEDDSDSGPIGVPDDYPIPGGAPGGYTPYERKSRVEHGGKVLEGSGKRYMEGDEWLPANYSADMIFALQQQLVKSGLLTTNFTSGVWDPQSREAYRELLGIANAGGVDANRALAQMVADAASFPQMGAEPLITQTTDPTVLRQAFRRAVIDLTGEGWSREQINNMVESYNQAEISAQQQAYDMEMGGQGGNIVQPASPNDWIDAKLREEHPEQVAEEETLGFINDILNMSGGGGWQG